MAPGELLTDPIYLEMRRLGIADAYWHLLMLSWGQNPPCSVPDNDAELAAWSGLGEKGWGRHGARLRAAFTPEGGRLVSAWLLARYRKAAERMETARENGRKGGRPRKPAGSPPVAHGLPVGSPPPTRTPPQLQVQVQEDTNPGERRAGVREGEPLPGEGAGGWARVIARAFPPSAPCAGGREAAAAAVLRVAERDGCDIAAAGRWLLGRVEAYARSRLVATTEQGYRVSLKTWMAGKAYDDDDVAWAQERTDGGRTGGGTDGTRHAQAAQGQAGAGPEPRARRGEFAEPARPLPTAPPEPGGVGAARGGGRGAA